ncbi:MAG: hypothetical protein J7518_22460 [Nocardioidaceae bacterium]|nr:hypothetical protein [Nocardioidaceae bacterium]
MSGVVMIREAASLMRERAEAVQAAPVSPMDWSTCSHVVVSEKEHIASWHPVVALAVADWLDWLAPFADLPNPAFVVEHGLAVARAYLGTDAQEAAS